MYGFGEKISTLIKARHMTLSSVAKKADLARETLSGIVNNRQVPRKSTLQKIADVLEMDYLEFVDEIGIAGGKPSDGYEKSQGHGFPIDANANIPVMTMKMGDMKDVVALTEVLRIASVAVKDGVIDKKECRAYEELMIKLIKNDNS